MPRIKPILAFLLFLAWSLAPLRAATNQPPFTPPSLAADTNQPSAKPAEAPHELPLHPGEIGHIGRFPITNSMLVTWIVALSLIVFAQLATRRITAAPSGIQNFWEWLVESLYTFLEGIIGHE